MHERLPDQVDMDSVLEVRSGLVVLKRGAERAVVLVSTGILGYALDRAKVCLHCSIACKESPHPRPLVPQQPAGLLQQDSARLQGLEGAAGVG